jgi:1D-myo-inositol 3-kinase
MLQCPRFNQVGTLMRGILAEIDFLTIGHVTNDRAPEGMRLGGTVSYAAITALRMGWRSGILTRAHIPGLVPGVTQVVLPDSAGSLSASLAGVAVHLLPSEVSTTFVNVYHGGARQQTVEAVADSILPGDLPAEWAKTPVVLLGPVARELPGSWADAFPSALMGITPQGWMRYWDVAGRVRPGPWAERDVLMARADAVILSREDVGGDDQAIRSLAEQAKLLVVTDGWHGAVLYEGGQRYQVPPRQAVEVDPTGAGDVFATSFLIRLAESGDPMASIQFANAVASFSVESIGMGAIPYRTTVDEWMAGAPLVDRSSASKDRE